MAFLASFTLFKLGFRNFTFPSAVRDDFQKLVAIVALVFCVNQLVVAVFYGFLLSVDSQDFVVTYRRVFPGARLATILNSSVNLFIYLLASNSFRVAFCDVFKDIVSCRLRSLQ